jgi:DNA invertase Pin-like site-specific DNA recombinase
MLKDAARHRFDVLMAWYVNQPAHTMQDLVPTFAALQQAGIDLYVKEQGVDTTTPSGRALFEMAGIFAAFDRTMTRARASRHRPREGSRQARPPQDQSGSRRRDSRSVGQRAQHGVCLTSSSD